jgi:hypothetical protein
MAQIVEAAAVQFRLFQATMEMALNSRSSAGLESLLPRCGYDLTTGGQIWSQLKIRTPK